MTIGEKIKILRENREWTQAAMAKKLNISPATVQKWEVEKNDPPLKEIKRLCALFGESADCLLDDTIEVMDYILIDIVPSECFEECSDSDHKIYDAGLKKEAKLHRFNNKSGSAYSAIYFRREEVYSCEREHESDMIKCWNEMARDS